jgi:hypothetical protein
MNEIIEKTSNGIAGGRLTKKERNPVEILPPQGYAQQEVHPCPLDNKARYAVAHLFQSWLLNLLYSRAFYDR